MLVNYFRIAFRYLAKNKVFSIINIFGLTLGYLCFLCIALYLRDELRFDMFHRDANRMYRVLQHEQQDDGTERTTAPIAARIAPESIRQIPETEDATRLSAIGRTTVGNDPANRNYERLMIADANFFRFFDFRLLEGDPKTALNVPDGVVLSEQAATKYFPHESALGKRLWTSGHEFTVTGVMQDFPKNSHLQFTLLFAENTWMGAESYARFANSDWSSNSYVTYMKLKPGADAHTAAQKMDQLVKKNYPADKKFRSHFSLQAMNDIHLNSGSIQGNDINTNGMKPFYLYMFGAVALLILAIACLNYMNLSTAAAYKRTREMGTRKTLGAMKIQLISQFCGEAVILSLFSLVLALCVLQALLPAINAFTQKEMTLSLLSGSWLAIVASAIAIAGVLSSLYPALVVSRIRPSEALKKDLRFGHSSIPMRKMLVVAQFVISIMMIASTLIIYRQITYVRTLELGFDRENLVVIDINSPPLWRNFENVKAEFRKIGEVQNITTSTRVPGEWKSFPVATVKATGSDTPAEMIFVGADQDFLATYDIALLEGRNFVSGKSDSTKVILTRLAVEALHLTNPVGQVIEIPTVRWGGSINAMDKPFRAEVIGVADDFHFESLRQKMMPVIFGYPSTPIQRMDYYTLRLATANWPETLNRLKETYRRLDPDTPMEYTLLDSRFEEFYKADVQRGKVFLVFSCIIVLIACLGLFALVSFAVESRTKEIGVRKVLGASVQNIVGLLSKEFLVLVVAAGAISIPTTYYLMSLWLQDFAYHVTMSAGVFMAAALIALLIAFVTVSFRSVRAALANPVESLRNE